MEAKYHAGELEVQERAGVRKMADKIGNGIRSFIPEAAQDFLGEQSMLVMSSVDSEGQVWVSLLTGQPGFVEVLDDETIEITPGNLEDDQLYQNLSQNPQVGIIAIEFANRRRMRLNGEAELKPQNIIRVKSREVFANCPKYIQARETSVEEAIVHGKEQRARGLTENQQSWIKKADTFFIGSYNPEWGADASHRGGQPGFVKVLSPDLIAFADYSGNNMFQTLGNLATYPKSGLLFVDFETGNTLQLTGSAKIIWDEAYISQFPGAQRVVEFQIDEVIQKDSPNPHPWYFLNYSSFNPKAE